MMENNMLENYRQRKNNGDKNDSFNVSVLRNKNKNEIFFWLFVIFFFFVFFESKNNNNNNNNKKDCKEQRQTDDGKISYW